MKKGRNAVVVVEASVEHRNDFSPVINTAGPATP